MNPILTIFLISFTFQAGMAMNFRIFSFFRYDTNPNIENNEEIQLSKNILDKSIQKLSVKYFDADDECIKFATLDLKGNCIKLEPFDKKKCK